MFFENSTTFWVTTFFFVTMLSPKNIQNKYNLKGDI